MLVLRTGYRKAVNRLAFAPDGRGLAAAGPGGTYHWPDWAAGRPATQLASGYGNAVAFTPDGRSVLESAFDTGPRLWTDGRPRTLPTGRPTAFVTVSPAEPLAVTNDGLHRIAWRLDPSGEPAEVWRQRLTMSGAGEAFAPDGSWLVSVDAPDRGCAFVFRRPQTGEPFAHDLIPELIQGTPAASAEWVAIPHAAELLLVPLPGRGGSIERVAGGAKKFVTDVAFHPSGRHLAVTSNDKTVTLFDVSTRQPARTFTWAVGKLRSVAFSPDGTLAAVGGDAGKVVVWDLDL
jgi:WD40 repeat protein